MLALHHFYHSNDRLGPMWTCREAGSEWKLHINTYTLNQWVLARMSRDECPYIRDDSHTRDALSSTTHPEVWILAWRPGDAHQLPETSVSALIWQPYYGPSIRLALLTSDRRNVMKARSMNKHGNNLDEKGQTQLSSIQNQAGDNIWKHI